jgi:hypothetical protein
MNEYKNEKLIYGNICFATHYFVLSPPCIPHKTNLYRHEGRAVEIPERKRSKFEFSSSHYSGLCEFEQLMSPS